MDAPAAVASSRFSLFYMLPSERSSLVICSRLRKLVENLPYETSITRVSVFNSLVIFKKSLSRIWLFSIDATDIQFLCMFMSRENVGQNLN